MKATEIFMHIRNGLIRIACILCDEVEVSHEPYTANSLIKLLSLALSCVRLVSPPTQCYGKCCQNHLTKVMQFLFRLLRNQVICLSGNRKA